MGTLINSIHTDVRVGLRALGKTSLPTAVAIGTVAVAIALTTLTLSAVYGALLRPLPFERAGEVMAVAFTGADFEARELRYFRQNQTAFESVEGYFRRRATVLGMGDYPESVRTGFVTASAFTALGVQPVLGRLFRGEEGLTAPVQHVLLGYDLWQSRYAGDPGVAGRRIEVDGFDLEILGVMPADFAFPVAESLWVPIDLGYGEGPASGRSFLAFGRLRANSTREQAEAEASSIALRIQAEYSAENPPTGATVEPFARRQLPAGVDSLLFVMLAAVAGVTLIASSNLANLLLARSATRGAEVAVRTALGASPLRIVQQFVIEALVFSSVGTVAGCALAIAGMGAMTNATRHLGLPYWVTFQADGVVLAGTAMLMVSIALVAGLLPAMRAIRGSAHASLQRGGRGTSAAGMGRAGASLVTLQIALSLALMVGAGLLIKSVASLRSLDTGFEVERVLTARISVSPAHPDPNRFFVDLMRELETLPTVSQAAVARNAPGTGDTFAWKIWVEGREYGSEQDIAFADGKPVGHGYFDALGMDLIEGRDFEIAEALLEVEADVPGVVIVNRTFASRYLGSGPIGQRVQIGRSDPDDPWFTVVGVVGDAYVGSRSGGIGLQPGSRPQMYIPWGVAPYRSGVLLMATRGEPEASIAEVRDVLAALSPDMPLTRAVRLSTLVEETTWVFGLFGRIFSVFGGVALLMAAAGLYGVMAFNVQQRRREMGTRIALGASPSDILGGAMRDGVTRLVIGLAVGIPLALLLAQALESVIFDVGTGDPQVFVVAIGVVLVTGLTASLLPSLTAARMDAQTALRMD